MGSTIDKETGKPQVKWQKRNLKNVLISKFGNSFFKESV
jgi:hypothetical protein